MIDGGNPLSPKPFHFLKYVSTNTIAIEVSKMEICAPRINGSPVIMNSSHFKFMQASSFPSENLGLQIVFDLCLSLRFQTDLI